MATKAQATLTALLERDAELGTALQHIERKVTSVGRKNAAAIFALGDCLNEARRLLNGLFGAWISLNFEITPRAAHNYRRVSSELAPQRELLIKSGVLPTVLIKLASTPEIREAAIADISEGQRLKVGDLRKYQPRYQTAGAVERTAPSQAARAVARGVGEIEAEIEAIIRQKDCPSKWPESVISRMQDIARRLDGLAAFLGDGQDGKRWSKLADLLREGPNMDWQSWRTGLRGRKEVLGTLSRASEFTSVPAVVEPPCTVWGPASGLRRPGLTVLELCAGAGGLALGLKKAGFDAMALVERSEAACKTLALNFPEAKVLNCSIEGLNLADFSGVDLVSGGLPCPPFSQAGNMHGRYDERNLFSVGIDIVGKLLPRAVLFENVKGITIKRHVAFRLEIISGLEQLGYTCFWKVLAAEDYGVAQKRHRAFLVAFRDSSAAARFAWPTFTPPYYIRPMTVYDAVRPVAESKGWKIPDDVKAKLSRFSPTITGGSEKKTSLNLGRPSVQKVWRSMEVIGKYIPIDPPEPDHVGPFRLTLPMLAAIQGFPRDWQFSGTRVEVLRQIANAVPHPMAAYVGASIRLALTGEDCTPHKLVNPLLWMGQSLRLGLIDPAYNDNMNNCVTTNIDSQYCYKDRSLWRPPIR
jgi:DNA-cytosine methyltransferase